MLDARQLPAFLIQIINALTRPDPAPPRDLDSPLSAIARRLPSMPHAQLVYALGRLNALGLTRIPTLLGPVDRRVTAAPQDWITRDGWLALWTWTERTRASRGSGSGDVEPPLDTRR